ncbi:hypothetical protein [Sphaerisporangium sp. TRM90804]|uniref:hypothetical protein n=1 Tax=Sphaerisporangium sp. TRM90804 TaxID=3031113 RepID=UPI002446B0ED|nr:hypothetical protein [Sphaerisporangium sp. TRM90804]MDH2426440.1 hypothetical protein [Sphaerisporangium sp. TRM90804]
MDADEQYELVREGLGTLVGACSQASATERGRPAPDAERIALLTARQSRYWSLRSDLQPDQVPQLLEEITAELATTRGRQ